jgi:hypothetical protein
MVKKDHRDIEEGEKSVKHAFITFSQMKSVNLILEEYSMPKWKVESIM